MNETERQANRRAVKRMTELRPILKTLATARDVVPGMTEDLLLHAGPPIEWQRMTGPMRGAVIGALLYEGRAGDEAEAVELVESGEVRFAPCHHHRAAAPMAGLISPSMAVYVVEDEAGQRTFSNLNEGYGKVLRWESTCGEWSSSASPRASILASPTSRRASARSAPAWCDRRWRSSRRRYVPTKGADELCG